MYEPICNRFHAYGANSGKIRTFTPFFTLSFEGNSLTQGQEISSHKTEVLVVAYSEDFVILACTVLIQITGVTDGRTDASTMARTRKNF